MLDGPSQRTKYHEFVLSQISLSLIKLVEKSNSLYVSYNLFLQYNMVDVSSYINWSNLKYLDAEYFQLFQMSNIVIQISTIRYVIYEIYIVML